MSVLCALLQIDCVVCSYCFLFIGSIEFQIGRRLYLHSIGASTGSTSERHCHGSDVGSSASCSGSTNGNCNAVPQEVIMSLMDGDTSLPFTDQFCLPSIVACPGGCEGELYCRFVFVIIRKTILSLQSDVRYDYVYLKVNFSSLYKIYDIFFSSMLSHQT